MRSSVAEVERDSLKLTLAGQEEEEERLLLKKSRETLRDIYDRHKLPECLTEAALCLFVRLTGWQRSGRRRMMEKLAFATYRVCSESGVPRTMRHVADMFGVRVKAIWKLEEHHYRHVCHAPRPSSYGHAGFGRLQLSFVFGRVCKKLADQLFDGGTNQAHPMTLLAVVTYVLLKKCNAANKVVPCSRDCQITMGEVANAFRVSVSSLKRVSVMYKATIEGEKWAGSWGYRDFANQTIFAKLACSCRRNWRLCDLK